MLNNKSLVKPSLTHIITLLLFCIIWTCPFGCAPTNRQAATSEAGVSGQENTQAQLVEVRNIWDKAPHNAFTDLIRYKGKWFCAFREGQTHSSTDGKLRIITSRDGRKWKSAALITSKTEDLRDAKLSIRPDGKLMLIAAAAVRKEKHTEFQTRAWLSSDGRKWSDGIDIGEKNVWLWRIAWHKGIAYGVGYDALAGGDNHGFVRLYKSKDGIHYETVIDKLYEKGYPSEAALLFDANDTAYCLLRRDDPNLGYRSVWGVSQPPYTDWTWNELIWSTCSPAMMEIPGVGIVAASRSWRPGIESCTALWRIEPKTGELTTLLIFPSRGDTSYPGLVWHDGLLWVSYYSAHEGTYWQDCAIYMAKVKFPCK